jgi:hypothetical protein
MCGIFGTFTSQQSVSFEYTQVKEHIEGLFQSSLRRGSEAAGLAVYGVPTNNHHANPVEICKVAEIQICKVAEQAPYFLQSQEYKKLVTKISSIPLKAVIGHARLATNGSSKKQINNQPVVSQNETVIGVHNGIITNFENLPISSSSRKHKIPELDTQVALDFIEHQIIEKKQTIEQAILNLLEVVEGTLNLALLFPKFRKIALVTNHGSLYMANNISSQQYFSSESIFLEKALNHKQNELKYSITQLDLNKPYVFEIEPNKPYVSEIGLNEACVSEIGLNEACVSEIDLNEACVSEIEPADTSRLIKSKSTIYFTYQEKPSRTSTLNTLSRLKKHTIDTKKIADIPRCKKCILPITTPFISFDEKGICNYCHEHTRITYKGTEALEKILAPFRASNSSKGCKSEKSIENSNEKIIKKSSNKPDCLVAFSGGRDSSYGLHLIKNELGMNPIAYTYDWGMISDLGRRNQARVLQKLGVEHIVVSADIAKKRRHIRKNILAWMKKPHLGMVPLFMQGDKQCEFYADRIMREYDIPLMFYCRGNELEKEEFKTGHCGVRDADPGGVIHNLAWKNKLKLLGFYGTQYLKNPAYFNESTFDTAFAYFSTYVQPHNYVYLWHYLPWNENQIVSTLTTQYGWELSPETPTSWRIGDGTPAFYNYIYYQVQGFTENDSLRARQVREGILSRDQALELVFAENAPQYGNLKWYFDTLELDGDAVLSVVDGMERLY